jgi:hypothetical protein
MYRPFIREPGLVNRWLQGDRKSARCISSNGCFKPGLEEGGVYCVVEKKSRNRRPKNNSLKLILRPAALPYSCKTMDTDLSINAVDIDREWRQKHSLGFANKFIKSTPSTP